MAVIVVGCEGAVAVKGYRRLLPVRVRLGQKHWLEMRCVGSVINVIVTLALLQATAMGGAPTGDYSLSAAAMTAPANTKHNSELRTAAHAALQLFNQERRSELHHMHYSSTPFSLIRVVSGTRQLVSWYKMVVNYTLTMDVGNTASHCSLSVLLSHTHANSESTHCLPLVLLSDAVRWAHLGALYRPGSVVSINQCVPQGCQIVRQMAITI